MADALARNNFEITTLMQIFISTAWIVMLTGIALLVT